MAPTEVSILENYLVLPARLPDILTLQQFRTMFPPAQQSSPQIKTLYRDLQRQRAALVDQVQAEIHAEAKDGRIARRQMARNAAVARLEEHANPDEEIEIERALYGSASGARPRPHTLETIVPALAAAAAAMEKEIQMLEEEEAKLLEEVKSTVDGLSDLRYGKLENSALGEEALQSLETFRKTCENKS